MPETIEIPVCVVQNWVVMLENIPGWKYVAEEMVRFLPVDAKVEYHDRIKLTPVPMNAEPPLTATELGALRDMKRELQTGYKALSQ